MAVNMSMITAISIRLAQHSEWGFEIDVHLFTQMVDEHLCVMKCGSDITFVCANMVKWLGCENFKMRIELETLTVLQVMFY